jgi:hypothetical protein
MVSVGKVPSERNPCCSAAMPTSKGRKTVWQAPSRLLAYLGGFIAVVEFAFTKLAF